MREEHERIDNFISDCRIIRHLRYGKKQKLIHYNLFSKP